MHGEHRGRTAKCAIANHRVDYRYATRVSSVKVSLDKQTLQLAECPMEFEVIQEFPMAAGGGGGGRDERITLGIVRLNLSEYVEESENLLRERDAAAAATAAGGGGPNRPPSSGGLSIGSADLKLSHRRSRSNASGATTGTSLSGGTTTAVASSSTGGGGPADDARSVGGQSTATTGMAAAGAEEGGVVRRYLMQDSKVNSTLKIGVLMVQIDGERNYVAPPLRTAPVFTGIAGLQIAGAEEQQGNEGEGDADRESRSFPSHLFTIFPTTLLLTLSTAHPTI